MDSSGQLYTVMYTQPHEHSYRLVRIQNCVKACVLRRSSQHDNSPPNPSRFLYGHRDVGTMASLDFWGSPTPFSSGSNNTDSNMRPSLTVNPSMLGSTSAMSHLGSETPHVLQEVGGTSLNIDMNWHSPSQVYPRSDHAAPEKDQLRPVDAPCDRASGALTIVPYRGPEAKTRREPRCRRRAYRVDALIKDKNPRSEYKRDKLSGQFQGSFQVFGANERIRSDFNDGSRSTTAITREFGACERCKGQKIRCNMSKDLFMPCERCSKTSYRYLKAPCIRISICSLSLHRRGSTLNNNLRNWTLAQEDLFQRYFIQFGSEALETLTVLITQDQGIEIPVTIRRFIPSPSDTTRWKWRDKNSQERVMEMPPFYICNQGELTRNMINAVIYKKGEYINCLLGAANPIVRKTFEAAFRYLDASNSSLVSNCLTFWVATRFIEKPWRICTNNLPDFEPLYEPYVPYEEQSPYSGIIPVTPIMDTQIDDIAIRAILNPLEKRILSELNRKILDKEKERENWFEIYLATFILLNNFEFVFRDVVDYTTRHGLTPSSTGAFSLSRGYFHACKTMLVYFRFACNGHAPLSLAWNNPSASIGSLTFDQREYIRDIGMEVKRQSRTLKRWGEGSVYRTPLYLCSQVLAEEWSPEVDNSEPIDKFTEEDFLTS
ncbi:hypothetical protein F5Y06DRAFT_174098 [Hypoxylon sp. FL0890]|nr:hypothetical protein F5Y06DRAFT_174098 [Hypoxylon sp. FL0890]